MKKVNKVDVLTKENRWNIVTDMIIALNYPSGNVQLDNIWRILNYYNEQSSGGHEGYLNWTVASITEANIHPFYIGLIETLESIGAAPLEELERKYGIELWRLHHALENQEITEEAYYHVIKLTDEVYFDYEDTFNELIGNYIEELFPQLFEIVDK